MAGSNLPEVSSFPVNITGPVATDAVTAASVRIMGVGLADRTKYLNDKARESAGLHAFPFVAVGGKNAATWKWSAFCWVQSSVVGTIDVLLAPIHIPNGSTITSIVASLSGAGGHAAAPAVTMSMDLRKHTAGGQTGLGVGGDVTAYPAYDSAHTMTLTPYVPVVVDNQTSAYVLAVTGESGAGSVSGTTEVYCIVVHFTPSA